MTDAKTDISRHIWETKYRYGDQSRREQTITDTWRRIARALAAIESTNAAVWEQRFFSILQDF
jgi:ribonucleoside-diphosphate reductase alpha chain